MRAILFLILVVLVFLIFRFTLNRIIEIRDRQNAEKLKTNNTNPSDENQDEKNSSQQMVRCAHCGVHLPQSEAYYDGKDTFCSEGHMQEYHEQHKKDE